MDSAAGLLSVLSLKLIIRNYTLQQNSNLTTINLGPVVTGHWTLICRPADAEPQLYPATATATLIYMEISSILWWQKVFFLKHVLRDLSKWKMQANFNTFKINAIAIGGAQKVESEQPLILCRCRCWVEAGAGEEVLYKHLRIVSNIRIVIIGVQYFRFWWMNKSKRISKHFIFHIK